MTLLCVLMGLYPKAKLTSFFIRPLCRRTERRREKLVFCQTALIKYQYRDVMWENFYGWTNLSGYFCDSNNSHEVRNFIFSSLDSDTSLLFAVFFPTGADSQLKPVTVDFHHEENRTAHKTDDYEIPQLIVRRGKEFDFTVTFNRDYHPEVDVIVAQFVTGKAFSMCILASVWLITFKCLWLNQRSLFTLSQEIISLFFWLIMVIGLSGAQFSL